MAERGIEVTYETIRAWCTRFGSEPKSPSDSRCGIRSSNKPSLPDRSFRVMPFCARKLLHSKQLDNALGTLLICGRRVVRHVYEA